MALEQVGLALVFVGLIGSSLFGVVRRAVRVARAQQGTRGRLVIATILASLIGVSLGWLSGSEEGGLLFLAIVISFGLVVAAALVLSASRGLRELLGMPLLEHAGVAAVGFVIGGLTSGLVG